MKLIGSYIKSDVYSAALCMINIYDPNMNLSYEDKDKGEDEKIIIIRSKMINKIFHKNI